MDLLIVPTLDGGDLLTKNGQAALDPSPRTAIYLSLFGGNVDDSGDDSDNSKQWWGNLVATDEAAVYRSRTQWALTRYPPSPDNLTRIEEAASLDLEWLRQEFEQVDVSARMLALDRLELIVELTIDGVTTPYTFQVAWAG